MGETSRHLFRAIVCTALLAGCLAGRAGAVALPKSVADDVARRIHAFVAADRFEEVAPQAITGDDWLSPERFPDAGTSVMLPDSRLDGLTKSLLLLESQEAPLPHARYRVTFRRAAASPDYGDVVFDFIEVTRFNLGPAMRQAIIDDNGVGHVGSKAQFGVGPTVTWRYVTGPIQGMRAALRGASRKVIDDDTARAADCLGVPCLDLGAPSGPEGRWQTMDAPETDKAAYRANDGLNARPARVADLLFAAAAPNGPEPAMGPSRTPQMTVVISRNIGQERAIDGLLRQSRLMDDAISAIWIRRSQVGPETIEWRRLVLP